MVATIATVVVIGATEVTVDIVETLETAKLELDANAVFACCQVLITHSVSLLHSLACSNKF